MFWPSLLRLGTCCEVSIVNIDVIRVLSIKRDIAIKAIMPRSIIAQKAIPVLSVCAHSRRGMRAHCDTTLDAKDLD